MNAWFDRSAAAARRWAVVCEHSGRTATRRTDRARSSALITSATALASASTRSAPEAAEPASRAMTTVRGAGGVHPPAVIRRCSRTRPRTLRRTRSRPLSDPSLTSTRASGSVSTPAVSRSSFASLSRLDRRAPRKASRKPASKARVSSSSKASGLVSQRSPRASVSAAARGGFASWSQRGALTGVGRARKASPRISRRSAKISAAGPRQGFATSARPAPTTESTPTRSRFTSPSRNSDTFRLWSTCPGQSSSARSRCRRLISYRTSRSRGHSSSSRSVAHNGPGWSPGLPRRANTMSWARAQASSQVMLSSSRRTRISSGTTSEARPSASRRSPSSASAARTAPEVRASSSLKRSRSSSSPARAGPPANAWAWTVRPSASRTSVISKTRSEPSSAATT